MLSRFVITFFPRSKSLLISWLQSPSAVILDDKDYQILIMILHIWAQAKNKNLKCCQNQNSPLKTSFVLSKGSGITYNSMIKFTCEKLWLQSWDTRMMICARDIIWHHENSSLHLSHSLSGANVCVYLHTVSLHHQNPPYLNCSKFPKLPTLNIIFLSSCV